MPPKPKQIGKKFPPKLEQSSKVLSSTLSTISTESTRSGLPPEAEDRFELELLWCIQQLQSDLINGKMSEKQIYIASKNLSTLKSDSASLIKKRQIMRNTFGDYRAKMSEDEKKFKKTNSSVKFASSVPTTASSLFVKKAQRSQSTPSTVEIHVKDETKSSATSVNNLFSSDVTNEPFKFNFTRPEN